MTEYRNIRFDTAGGVATIGLNRPPLNVLNIEMMGEINSALEKISQNPAVKVAVFRGEGKCFSAGVDVGEHTGELAARMIDVFHRMFRLMDAMPQPTVAVLHKSALGGGCELAAFCDIALAKDDVKIGQPEIQVGVFPPIAAAAFPALMGAKKAFDLILSGAVLGAREALEAGLVSRVFASEAFEAESKKYLENLAGLSGIVLRITKKAIKAGKARSSLATLGEIEKIYLNELMATHDANEGLKAFLDKRKPVWEER